MEFIRNYQLDIMLILTGVCGILPVFVLMSGALTQKRKHALIFMEVSAVLLLISDRLTYIFMGNMTLVGFYVLRICNFLVFVFTLLILYAFDLYMIELCLKEAGLEKAPARLIFVKFIVILGEVIIIISQFTGFYYSFDEHNQYRRSASYYIGYVIPIVILLIEFSVIIQYYKRLNKGLRISLVLFSIVPVIACAVQIFVSGVSLTNLALVGLVVLLYIFALLDTSSEFDRASKHEIELLKQQQDSMHTMFEQTASALATAIDAKDKYTNGHSVRVATYSRMIAKRLGLSEEDQEKIYYMGLLHDIGKIGIPKDIINKTTKLTDEEFELIQSHPILGYEILEKIKSTPDLALGARWHHEYIDGTGYPDGKKGDEIPLLVKIVAVADSYDAMTSNRSYRKYLPQDVARAEIEKGIGTQFDPDAARCMIEIIDLDKDYSLHE